MATGSQRIQRKFLKVGLLCYLEVYSTLLSTGLQLNVKHLILYQKSTRQTGNGNVVLYARQLA